VIGRPWPSRDHGEDGADARSVGDGTAPTAVARPLRAYGGSSLDDVAMGSSPATTGLVTRLRPSPALIAPVRPCWAPGGRFAHRTVADGAWRSAVDGGVPRNAGLGVHGGDGADARYVGDGRAPTAVSRARRASGGSSLRDVAMGSPPATTCDVTRLRPSPALIAPVRPSGLPGDDSRIGRSPMRPQGVPVKGDGRGTAVFRDVGVERLSTTSRGVLTSWKSPLPTGDQVQPSPGGDGLPQSIPHPADDPLPRMRQPVHDVRLVDRNVRDPGLSSATDPSPARGDREGFREGKAHLSLPDATGVGVPSSNRPTGAPA
jgi:hypothetical protein